MTTYARIQNDTAVEVFMPHSGFSLVECFHPEVAVLFVEVPDGTEAGATTTDGGSTWTNPTEPAEPAPAPTVYDLLTPMQFYLAFKTQERKLLKALATTGLPANSAFNATATAIPVDPDIEEFWATFQMALQEKSNIDPNLTSIQEGLEYLARPTAPTPSVITADRIPQILAGIAQ
jgi:hypothetical protein